MTMPRCQALLVAAPASGQGKTTVASALARLHARAGRRVRVFKCGPDFLDPTWLAAASGAPVHSLDLWINGEADCRARLAAAAREADLLIVEGVMGLHDGMPSAADLARRFGLPVLAVVDAGAMAETFGAVVHGLRHWRADARGPLRWAGVVANRVGSARHAQMLQDALAPDDRWCGHLPRSEAWRLPERHLGVAAAGERPDALARLDAAADALAGTALGRWPLIADDSPCRWTLPAASDAPPDTAAQSRSATRPLAGRTIALARDAAFAFIYPANVDTLEALGARVVRFAPLAGESLPRCDAIWLPGGYPELHAAALSSLHRLRAQLQAHLAEGRPLWAECGGLMALAETLVDGEGREHALWGLLPGRVALGQRLAALGPQSLTLGDQTLRGHAFHWSRFETPLAPATHAQPARGDGPGEALYLHGPRQALRASYFHAWFASSPAATARLFLPAEAGGLGPDAR